MGRPGLVPVLLAAVTFGGCGTGMGRTFEPGKEYVPGPAILVVRVVPPEARDTRRIELSTADGSVKAFRSHAGEDRFLTGVTLPSTLNASVDGVRCDGSMPVSGDIEYDATLRIDASGCSLQLDRSHPPDAIDHALQDDDPLEAPRIEPTGWDQNGRRTISATIVAINATSR
jgi:hypothetical protein